MAIINVFHFLSTREIPENMAILRVYAQGFGQNLLKTPANPYRAGIGKLLARFWIISCPLSGYMLSGPRRS